MYFAKLFIILLLHVIEDLPFLTSFSLKNVYNLNFIYGDNYEPYRHNHVR
jgi:hypothetical protein